MQIGKNPRLALVAVLLACVVAAGEAQADATKSIDTSSAQEVVEGMANKLARGVANIATGWMEFPKQIALTMQEEGVAKGMMVGPLKGVGMAFARTAAGVGEAVTFPVAWPEFYEPYLEPEYVWQKE